MIVNLYSFLPHGLEPCPSKLLVEKRLMVVDGGRGEGFCIVQSPGVQVA